MKKTWRGAWWLVAAALALGVVCAPPRALAYRRGLGSSLGGATLGHGHVVWLAAGYPSTSIGWGVAVHPRLDLGLHADVVYGSPAWIGQELVGGGGGAWARLELVRGRTSAALSLDFSATGYQEGGAGAALVNLGSPSLDLSFRLGPRLALHAGLSVVIHYVTPPEVDFATRSNVVGGFEARAGVTWELRPNLALLGAVSTGATVWSSQDQGTPRLEALLGLEYRIH